LKLEVLKREALKTEVLKLEVLKLEVLKLEGSSLKTLRGERNQEPESQYLAPSCPDYNTGGITCRLKSISRRRS
jgi:hypothetical protein